jgi:hypothetical protein
MWDKAGEIPSGWGDGGGGPGAVGRANAFFYKKLQYRGSVNQVKRNKKQPLPQSRDILRQKGVDLTRSVDVLGERVTSREEL